MCQRGCAGALALLFDRDARKARLKHRTVGRRQKKRASRVIAAVRRFASFLTALALTFIGLTAITFFIGRLTKIDPVLAVVGDKASKEVYDRTFLALGLDQPLIVQYGLSQAAASAAISASRC